VRSQSKVNRIRTVFLDRDGVINRKQPEGAYVTSWDQFAMLPGVPRAIKRMNDAGMTVIVVSNQHCIALGLCTRAGVDEIHQRLQDSLETEGGHIDRFYICEHNAGMCVCRKPDIGLFQQALADFPQIRPESSVMIGDSLSDMEFGHRASMQTIFIEGRPETARPGASRARTMANVICQSLPQAVRIILSGLPDKRNSTA